MPTNEHALSARMVLLLHDEHDAFWQLTQERMKSIMDYADFTDTQAKLEMFEHAYGTILFLMIRRHFLLPIQSPLPDNTMECFNI